MSNAAYFNALKKMQIALVPTPNNVVETDGIVRPSGLKCHVLFDGMNIQHIGNENFVKAFVGKGGSGLIQLKKNVNGNPACAVTDCSFWLGAVDSNVSFYPNRELSDRDLQKVIRVVEREVHEHVKITCNTIRAWSRKDELKRQNELKKLADSDYQKYHVELYEITREEEEEDRRLDEDDMFQELVRMQNEERFIEQVKLDMIEISRCAKEEAEEAEDAEEEEFREECRKFARQNGLLTAEIADLDLKWAAADAAAIEDEQPVKTKTKKTSSPTIVADKQVQGQGQGLNLPTIIVSGHHLQSDVGPMSFSYSRTSDFAMLPSNMMAFTYNQPYVEKYINVFGQVHTHMHIWTHTWISAAAPMQYVGTQFCG